MFKVMGITNDVTECECCGRKDLKRTVRLGRLDADGAVAEVLYFGSACAARATMLRRTSKAMEVLAEEAQRRADEEKTRRVVVVNDNPVDVTWVVESVGQNGGSFSRLCLAKGTRSAIEAWATREYPRSIINVRKAV